MKRKIAFAAFIFAFFATSSVAAAPKVEHYILNTRATGHLMSNLLIILLLGNP